MKHQGNLLQISLFNPKLVSPIKYRHHFHHVFDGIAEQGPAFCGFQVTYNPHANRAQTNIIYKDKKESFKNKSAEGVRDIPLKRFPSNFKHTIFDRC